MLLLATAGMGCHKIWEYQGDQPDDAAARDLNTRTGDQIAATDLLSGEHQTGDDASSAPDGPCLRIYEQPWPLPWPLNDETTDDWAPSVFYDDAAGELVVFFASWRGGSKDNIWSSRFNPFLPPREWSFTEPVQVAGVNSEYNDKNPTISPDGLTLYFASNRSSAGDNSVNPEIYVATRANQGEPFNAPQPLALEPPPSQWDPELLVLDNGEHWLHYSSWHYESLMTRIFVTKRSAGASPTAFSDPIPLEIRPLPESVEHPALSADGLTLYFSVRPKPRDLYRATRPSLNDPFTGAEPLLAVTSMYEDDETRPATAPAYDGPDFLLFCREGGANGESTNIYISEISCQP